MQRIEKVWYAFWLGVAMLFAVGVAHADPTITEAIMGRPVPPRLSLEYQRYAAELQYTATNVVAPINRATTYYFSTSGSDANNGLTTSTPKQTIGALNTLIAASGGNTAFLLKCGDVFQSSTGINGHASADNCTLGSWSTGPRPVVEQTPQTLASGGTLWALGSGNRYSATVAGAVGVIFRTNEPDFIYKHVASTAECEATPYSIYKNGTTLHMNDGGADPDLRAFKYSLASTTDDSGIEVPAGCTGWRIDNVEFRLWAADGEAVQNSGNQEYGLKASINGTDKIVCTNVKATWNVRHSFGLNGGANSGGWIYLAGCEAGICTEPTAAPFVFYQQNGGQEVWAFGNSTPWGAVPTTAARTWVDGFAFLVHTQPGTSTPPGFVHVQDHLIPANAQGWGCHNGVAIDNMAYEANPNLCEAVVIGTRMERADGTGMNGDSAGLFIARQGTLEIGGHYELYPRDSPTDAMASGDPRGFVYTTEYRVDLTNPGMTEGWFAFYNPTAATNDPKLRGCFFEIISNGTTDFALSYDCNFGSTTSTVAGYATGAELSGSVWSVRRKYPTSTADVIKPGFPNSSACLKNNAYYLPSADETYIGISNTVGAVTLVLPPIWGVTPAQGSPLANAGRGGQIPYDLLGHARNVVTPTIGPREMPTEILIAPTAAEMAFQIGLIQTSEFAAYTGSMGKAVGDTATKASYLPPVPAGDAGGLLIAGDNDAFSIGGVGLATTGSIADAVHDEPLAGHLTAGSSGKALNDTLKPTVAGRTLDVDADGDAESNVLKFGSSPGSFNAGVPSVQVTQIQDGVLTASKFAANAFTGAKFAADFFVKFVTQDTGENEAEDGSVAALSGGGGGGGGGGLSDQDLADITERILAARAFKPNPTLTWVLRRDAENGVGSTQVKRKKISENLKFYADAKPLLADGESILVDSLTVTGSESIDVTISDEALLNSMIEFRVAGGESAAGEVEISFETSLGQEINATVPLTVGP